MKSVRPLAFWILTLSATVLHAQGPTHIFDKQADFSRYKTYQWVNFPNAIKPDELTQTQLTGTLQVELTKKGFRKAPSGAPDLYIAYQIVSSTPKQPRIFDVSWPDGSTLPGVFALGKASVLLQSGQLILDFYDSSKKCLVWRSVVLMPGDENGKPEKRQREMDKAAEKLLKNYPPR